MYDNRNWLWQYQNTKIVKTIYDRFFDVASEASPDKFKDLYNIDKMDGEGLYLIAKILGVPVIYGENINGLTWEIDSWNDPTKFWNGVVNPKHQAFYKQYIKSKIFLYGKPFNNELIKGTLDVLFKGYEYTCATLGDNFYFEIELTIDPEIKGITETILEEDKYLFGKPSGVDYKIIIS